MESILYRNKRNTYSIDNSVIKAAVNEGKPASAYIERIMCSRDGRLFEKVPNEPRYTCNGEVIERGVKEDLQVCIKNLNEAIAEYAEELNDVKEKLLEGFNDSCGLCGDQSAITEWSALDPDYFEWLPHSGRKIHKRIWLWLAAFEMAYKEIKAD